MLSFCCLNAYGPGDGLMLRALFFAVKVALLVAAAVWIANRPGFVQIAWLGYDVRAHVGIALAGFLIVAAFISLLFRLFDLPGTWRRRRRETARVRGERFLTRGFGALAAGDLKSAARLANRAQRLLPGDPGLTVFLQAQTARLQGEREKATLLFTRLLENPDTAFLGLRGLLQDALAEKDDKRALDLARRAASLHPRHPWVLRLLYTLAIRMEDWNAAERTLKRAMRFKAISAEKARSDRAALCLYRAEKATEARWIGHWLKKAYALAPFFVPSATRLARFYLDAGKRRQAIAVIEKTWTQSPHEDLALLWREAAPPRGKKKKGNLVADMRWAARLIARNPETPEGEILAATMALDDGLYGEAAAHLDTATAREGRLSPRIARLQAKLARTQGREEESLDWTEKAAEAPPGKAWICSETGRIYARWSPIAAPHGSFNTIVWDYPPPPGEG
ncbi:MAG: heme biosynthesis protein HemY, partial [Alphaproteobacteria bacterium]|nr:heme biosynthesis protein HemY [Alphaproteobacteria bacterium]